MATELKLQIDGHTLVIERLTGKYFVKLQGALTKAVSKYGISAELDELIDTELAEICAELLENESLYDAMQDLVKEYGTLDGNKTMGSIWEDGGILYTHYMDLLSLLITYVTEKLNEKKTPSPSEKLAQSAK